MEKAKVEGAYSVDSDREYVNNWNNLKYLSIPEDVNFNLMDGVYVYKAKYDKYERIKQLTSFVMDHKSQFVKNKRLDADILCFRGVLRIIMETPFQKYKPWIVHAVKFQGTIVLCMMPTHENEAKRVKLISSSGARDQYGFKFETYVLANDPRGSPPGKREPCKEAEEFCVVLSTRINNIKILFGSEIDGVESSEVIENINQLETAKLAEVKVKQQEINEKQVQNFLKFKTLAWWCQAVIVGIEEIHCGVHDENGIVRKVDSYNVKELAKEAEEKGLWNGDKCQKFLGEFLKRLENDMQDVNDPYIIYRYSWTNQEVHLEKIEGDTILPTTYIKFIQNL